MMRVTKSVALCALCLALLAGAAGCAKPQAQVAPDETTGTAPPVVNNPNAVQAIPPAQKAADAANKANEKAAEIQGEIDAATGD